jgi:hypothetical protein
VPRCTSVGTTRSAGPSRRRSERRCRPRSVSAWVRRFLSRFGLNDRQERVQELQGQRMVPHQDRTPERIGCVRTIPGPGPEMGSRCGIFGPFLALRSFAFLGESVIGRALWLQMSRVRNPSVTPAISTGPAGGPVPILTPAAEMLPESPPPRPAPRAEGQRTRSASRRAPAPSPPRAVRGASTCRWCSNGARSGKGAKAYVIENLAPERIIVLRRDDVGQVTRKKITLEAGTKAKT